jgi:type IV secretion system protein TrbD
MTQLIKAPFHRALHRSNLILGGEREWMIVSLMITGLLVVVSANLVSFFVGIIFGAITVTSLRAMAKSDPLMSKVYRRQVMYRDYYPAYSRPYRVAKSSRVY